MIQLAVIYSLLCFQTNTTVLLDVQTRELVFKAWPRTDDAREMKVCTQLNGDIFKLRVQVGTYDYELATLQTYDVFKYIEIKIPCADTVNKCNTAFKAKSAIYTMDFQEAKQSITEAASNLRRLDFNRKACVVDTALLYGQNVQIAPGTYTNMFKVQGTAQNCKYPLDDMATLIGNDPTKKKALFSFFAYPNFQANMPLFSITTALLVQMGQYPCIMMGDPLEIAWCDNMIQTLATSSFGYVLMHYYVPGLIPNRDGTLTRVANYTNVIQSNQVKDALQATLDCYSSQNIDIFSNTILLTNTLDPSMVYCKKPISEFIGIPYDKIVTRISFQQNEDFRTGNVYTLDFNTQSQMMNTTSEWLSCSSSTNETYCNEVLALGSTISSYFLNAQQIIYKDNNIVKILPLSPTMTLSCYSDAAAEIFDQETCVTITNICANNITSASNKQFTYSFGNEGKYSKNLLNITSQAVFPNSENKYCVNYDFSDSMITEITDQYADVPTTGVITIGSVQVPISSATDASNILPVKNIEWFIVGIAGLTFIIVGVSIWKPWV
ncbi:Conserved_hypothetical protein [Hexamita inflata]|uniref:Uncharacterized protein n=1 Tax=Hexamita inflata TaxID=28002 RepID=A0AA86NR48_9EUKA|nr:Conserved hypothetical protein [Hexamita inflata]